jgi:glycosyltransferase involved in cell wall biosynthesis
VQLVRSLLPALEHCDSVRIEEIFLPDSGELSAYARLSPGPAPVPYRRRLPNLLSRLLECTLLARQFADSTPLLILGDVPLCCDAPQIVFVQSAHICSGVRSPTWQTAIKHRLSRLLFRLNASHAFAFIVQTDVMRVQLEDSYPAVKGKVVVIPQPPPSWVLESGLRRSGRLSQAATKLDLFYPAASYAHKNHALLRNIPAKEVGSWPIERLALTIPMAVHPNPDVPWIECVGTLTSEEMLKAYSATDGLVFLSEAESYGLPLVEAIHIGLPVIAPDLPYARALCGAEAIYFSPASIDSLKQAVDELARRLSENWWPNWSEARAKLPGEWQAVATAFLHAMPDDS